jgi:hypothetical protein
MSDKTTNQTMRETLAALGVIASLLFVGAELRQSNAQAKAAAYQAIGAATAQAVDSWASDPGLAVAQMKAPEALTPLEWELLSYKHTAFARLGEMIQLQVAQGVLDEDAMQRLGYGGWRGLFGDPKLRCLWPQIAPGVSAEFRAFVGVDFETLPEHCRAYDVRFSGD